MQKRYKYRIYPNDDQKAEMAKWFGCMRFVWNHCIAVNNELRKNPLTIEGQDKPKSHMGWSELCASLPALKGTYEWLKVPYSDCLQQVTRDLGQAYQAAFKKGKGFPNFKKKDAAGAFRFPQAVKVIVYDKRYSTLVLPKLGKMKIRLSRALPPFKSCTILREPDGTYYASFVVLAKAAHPAPNPKTINKIIGVDLGVKDLAITSDGKIFKALKDANPNFKKTEGVLKTRQRKLARKVKGSNSWSKMRLLVAKAYAKLRRQRLDYLHNVASVLSGYGAVVFEDLNILKMTAKTKHSLKGMSKGILDGSWGILQKLVEYRMSDWRKLVQYVDPYNTSKRCNKCHAINHKLTLGIREWTCGTCGETHDRDINAAINIRNLASAK